MELTFTAIDNLDNVDNVNNDDYNTNKYWETEKKIQQKKKVRFSYDDILSSLNLVVSKDGALQYMTPNQPNEIQLTHNQLTHNQLTHNQATHNQSTHNNKNIHIQNQGQNQGQIQGQMKNSYIFNKYFKDYKDQSIVEKKIPKTKEEYNQMMLEERIKRIEAFKRVQQIKSTKMFFSNNMKTSISQRVTNLNRIFRM